MNILAVLATGARHYRGQGLNHQHQTFCGELLVQPLLDSRAAMLHYTATLDNGARVHAESTLLALDPDGRLTLWPVMTELPFVVPHRVMRETATAGQGLECVFASGPRDDTTSFREEITLRAEADGALAYAHAWGLPGGEFEDRSSCRMAPVGAHLEGRRA